MPSVDARASVAARSRLVTVMEATSVTSKDEVAIPKALRQRLGIRQGSRIEFVVVGNDVVIRVRSSPAAEPTRGFGLLESRRGAVPADLGPALLVRR